MHRPDKPLKAGFAMEGDVRTMQDDDTEVIGRMTQETKLSNCRMPT